MDVREAVVLSQRKQDTSRAAALPLTTEAAVANASTGRALPFLERKIIVLNSELCGITAI